MYGDRTGVYTGEVNEQDIPNGKGKFETKNSSGQVWIYEGNFVAGVPMKAETVGLNEDVTYADWMYRVTEIKTQKSAGNRQASGQYLILTMTAQNNGQETRQPGANNFYVLVDIETGNRYKMDDQAPLNIRLTNNAFQTDWFLTKVNPGNKATGYLIIFDIPENVDINNLVLLPAQSIGDATPIKLQK